jgi:hypothetical protein
VKRTWERMSVRGTPMASCGAPASQTHISTVAGSGHESYAKNTTRRRRQDKQKMRSSSEAPARTCSRHEG